MPTMLTAAQRADVLDFGAKSDLDPHGVTDDDIWYGFLSALFNAGMTLKDLKLSPVQKPEIMACLRRAPSLAPRAFTVRGEGLVRSVPTTRPNSR